MIKNLIYTTISALLLSGCGTGTETTNTPAATTNDGKYNLWEYMTPNKPNTSTFTLSSNSIDSKYTTTYSVTNNRVTEIADYAQDEITIYEKDTNKITVRFEKNGKANGEYALKLTANINDIVTIRNSTCTLSKHYDHFTIADKTFDDVIEITCGAVPGYYQRGVGEVAQKEDKSGKNIRVLSN